MSPAVREDGAKGPTRRDNETQMRRECIGSELKWKIERMKKIAESEIEMKRVGLWR